MDIRACLFDVFGTVVDWRSSVSRDLAAWAKQKGIDGIDWLEFAVEWRKLYQPSMEEVRSGRREFTILDVLHRESLDKLIARYAIKGLSGSDVEHMNRAWHRLQPWPDVVQGLTQLKSRFIIAPCSNGNIARSTRASPGTASSAPRPRAPTSRRRMLTATRAGNWVYPRMKS
jgi:2-haloacid dehalogenase